MSQNEFSDWLIKNEIYNLDDVKNLTEQQMKTINETIEALEI